ncbi:tetratricopeptide repeat protein [Clostridium tagluense]|uniref:Uncharacterized protein n=1 Tax=Clostridium tagluense TaxID=360422 RepID=A0A401UKH1_9CLOT|nr:tetratricopeptide repeat protein [Clostridium tagluense]GCD10047.1 hypothetical protein Ctaglu_16700 [Clostridium tagluense]
MDILLKEIEELTEKIKVNPGDKKYYSDRAILHNKTDRFDLAMEDYDEIIKMDSKDHNAYYKRACEWYNWKVYYLDEIPDKKETKKNTIDYLEKAVSIKEEFKYYYRIAEIYFNLLEENELALEICKKALKTGKKTVDLYKLLGQVYNELGDYDKAVQSFEDALKLGEDSDVYFFRGITLCNLAMEVTNFDEAESLYNKAINDYDRAINLDTENIILYFKKAELLYEVFGESKEAIKTYKEILKLDSENEEVCIKTAKLYAELGDNQKQEFYYIEALKINSNNLEANESLADYYHENNKYEKALTYINKAIELNSDENWLQLAQGECYCELKEYDKALEVYDTILKNQNNEQAYDYRGDVYVALQQYDKAIGDYLKFIKLKPDAPGVYYRLGLAYKKNGEYIKAMESLNKATQLLPNNKKISDLINEIREVIN